MDDYINRENALNVLCDICVDNRICDRTYKPECHAKFMDIPAADGQRDRWISVEDAMPEIDERVLVYCDDPFDIPPHFPRRKLLLIGYLDMENNWYDSDGPLENVTYWMPLPKPPEVKE